MDAHTTDNELRDPTREAPIRMAGARAENDGDGQHDAAQTEPLFADVDDLNDRWSDIQAAFVDEPRDAIEQADSLVADVMDRITQRFANQREQLEGAWRRGDDVSTEDLRITLQRYRSFFQRLLTT